VKYLFSGVSSYNHKMVLIIRRFLFSSLAKEYNYYRSSP